MKQAVLEKLLAAAAHAYNMFDQADTGRAIERDLGSRGRLAREAIEELKKAVIEASSKITLPPPAASTVSPEPTIAEALKQLSAKSPGRWLSIRSTIGGHVNRNGSTVVHGPETLIVDELQGKIIARGDTLAAALEAAMKEG